MSWEGGTVFMMQLKGCKEESQRYPLFCLQFKYFPFIKADPASSLLQWHKKVMFAGDS